MEASQIQPINDCMRSSGHRRTQCWIFPFITLLFCPEDSWQSLGQIISSSVMSLATSLHPRSPLRHTLLRNQSNSVPFTMGSKHWIPPFYQLDYQAAVCNLDCNLIWNLKLIYVAVIALYIIDKAWMKTLICSWDQLCKQTNYSSNDCLQWDANYFVHKRFSSRNF